MAGFSPAWFCAGAAIEWLGKEILPAFAITIRLKTEHPPARVKELRENRQLENSYAAGSLEIRVPQLLLYKVIVIE